MEEFVKRAANALHDMRVGKKKHKDLKSAFKKQKC